MTHKFGFEVPMRTELCMPGSRIRFQPWYKERLLTKQLKETNKKQAFSGALNAHHWHFLKDRLDDFRDGYPPAVGYRSLRAEKKGPGPVLKDAQVSFSPVEQLVRRKRFTKDQVCFSKVIPLQKARNDYIAEIEYSLTRHPLALYPHLAEGMPPELFEQIVDVLDPDMHLGKELEAYVEKPKEKQETDWCIQPQVQEEEDMRTKGGSTRYSLVSEESKHKNPYRWLRETKENPNEDKKAKQKRALSIALAENLKRVTKEFCDWVASLGGESFNVDEATITSLFDSGYETKPALSVPIRVVELSNIPPALRMTIRPTPVYGGSSSRLSRSRSAQSKASSYHPSWVKIKYGAWYLDPSKWKKRRADEPLQDPDAKEDDMELELRTKLIEQNLQVSVRHLKARRSPSSKKKSIPLRDVGLWGVLRKLSLIFEMQCWQPYSYLSLKLWLFFFQDAELRQLHGIHAFKEFIERKGCRRPEVRETFVFKHGGVAFY
ncbi:protein FAM47E [Latimeria chalumnae]|uniref:protein FAM47E n=1 Tax=Latimeria chalumnae TaxID=7897 RepID=UPI00313A9471